MRSAFGFGAILWYDLWDARMNSVGKSMCAAARAALAMETPQSASQGKENIDHEQFIDSG
jgi:hypothetical protein